MNISSAFISDEQAPVSMEPGKGSLNNPAVLSKMRGTVHPTSGNAVLYMSHGCTPVCKTENRTLYQREVSEDDKWVSRANFAGTADDPAYIPTFCNHSHWRQ